MIVFAVVQVEAYQGDSFILRLYDNREAAEAERDLLNAKNAQDGIPQWYEVEEREVLSTFEAR